MIGSNVQGYGAWGHQPSAMTSQVAAFRNIHSSYSPTKSRK